MSAERFLSRMGWDAARIEVYLALVRNGPMSRTDLAAELSVTKSANTITVLLKKLQEDGAVDTGGAGQKNDAQTFHARPPEHVFKRLLDESEELRQACIGELTVAYDHSMAIQNRDTDWSVLGASGVSKVLQDALDHATRRVLVVGATISWCKARHVGRLADKMVKGKMDVRFVVPANCPQKDFLTLRNVPHLLLKDGPTLHALVADDEVLIPRADYRGLVRSANPQLVELVAKTIAEHKGAT